MTIEQNEEQTQRLLGLFMILTTASWNVHELVKKLMNIRGYEFQQKRKLQYNQMKRLQSQLSILYTDLFEESLDNAVVNVENATGANKFDALLKDSNDIVRMLMYWRNAVVSDKDNVIKAESTMKALAKNVSLFRPEIIEQFMPTTDIPKELLL